MKIKHPVNFAIGIFCTICFIINIVTGKDAFDLWVSAVAASCNLAFGLMR